jgi:hypothetical protein
VFLFSGCEIEWDELALKSELPICCYFCLVAPVSFLYLVCLAEVDMSGSMGAAWIWCLPSCLRGKLMCLFFLNGVMILISHSTTEEYKL